MFTFKEERSNKNYNEEPPLTGQNSHYQTVYKQ